MSTDVYSDALLSKGLAIKQVMNQSEFRQLILLVEGHSPLTVALCSRPPGGQVIPMSLFPASFWDGMFNEDTHLSPYVYLKYAS